MRLNYQATLLCDQIVARAEALRVAATTLANGTRLIDCGIHARGGLEAGRMLARVCLADLGDISFVPAPSELWTGPLVMVTTDHPVAACMASQYAGWQVSHGKFFGMGSGPMRAAAAREEIFAKIGHRETTDTAVGVLESG